MTSTRVYLVRHGQTIWNQEMKYQGHTDVELTDEGIYQAKLLAGRLSGESLSAIYASDLQRAYVTAEAVARRCGLSVTQDQALREICFGEWEGLTYAGIKERWNHPAKDFFTHPADTHIPGGEQFSEMQDRVCAALLRIIQQHPGQAIGIVSHGGAIRAILCRMLRMNLNDMWSIRQDNTAVNILDCYTDRTIVTLINDVHHLHVAGYAET